MSDGTSPDEHRRPAAAGVAVEVVVWWGLMVGIWVLTLSSVPADELAIAAACGLPCALAVAASRRASDSRWRPSPRWLAWLVPVAVAVWADSARVLVVAAKAILGLGRPEGELRTVQLPEERGPRGAARRAVGGILLSSTPGTFVMDEDPDASSLVVHTIVSGPPSVGRVIAS